MTDAAIVRAVSEYYAGKLHQHGATPRGVDWKDAASQTLRFDQLLMVLRSAPEGSLADIGCGYGDLLRHMRAKGLANRYLGVDIAPEMIEAALRLHGGDGAATFAVGKLPPEPADFVVASGIFNVRLSFPAGAWEEYVAATLDDMSRMSRRGFAFNCLTSYSDPPLMREDLFYADPTKYFDLCKIRYSRQVALLHDYGLYEFTIIVRKD
jgi:SAM-dependent methyltransferase